MKTNWLSLLYKIIILIVSLFVVSFNLGLYGIKTGIIYFTNLSALAVFIFYFISFILYLTNRLKKTEIYYVFKGSVTMAITLTFFVYLFVLSGNMNLENHIFSNTLSHIVLPLLVMSDYVFFAEKGNLQMKFVFTWGIPLLLYQLFVFVYSFMGGTFSGSKYPYPYMDVEKFGIIGVLLNCVVIFIFFIGYGTLIQSIDNYIAKKKDRK